MSLPVSLPARVLDERATVPATTVARLPIYHQALTTLQDQGVATVSSAGLAERTGVSSAKLRKDLSFLGSFGTRGVGYDVAFLRQCIAEWLGITQPLDVAIVGVGNLGHALASYRGFATRGFRVVALVDIDPERVGEQVVCGDSAVTIHALDDLAVVAQGAHIGVIATPDGAAQSVCDRLVAAGVRNILTFAPCVLSVPPHVEIRSIDLGIELQILAFRERSESARRRREAQSVPRSGFPAPAAGSPGAVSA